MADPKPILPYKPNHPLLHPPTREQAKRIIEQHGIREFNLRMQRRNDAIRREEQDPLHYGWEPQFIKAMLYEPGDFLAYICRDCVERVEDEEILREDYIADYIYSTNNKPIERIAALPDWCIPIIKKMGYKCLEDDMTCARFETGFHPGQTDDPQTVAQWMEENLPGHEYMFVITERGQFDVHWTVFHGMRGVVEDE